jgi:hypothetical protein
MESAGVVAGKQLLIGMGEVGWPSRIVGGFLGNPWIYVSESTDLKVAPGQFSVTAARDLFRLDKWRIVPSLFCVVSSARQAWEFARIFNRLFADHEIDAICIPATGSNANISPWIRYVQRSALPFAGLLTAVESSASDSKRWKMYRKRESGDWIHYISVSYGSHADLISETFERWASAEVTERSECRLEEEANGD